MTSGTVLEADVVVLGGGPAGCAAALNLAPFLRVLVLDKNSAPGTRIGESLPPAAGRLLRDMGLEQAFLRQGHLPCHVSRSTWGGAQLAEQDAMRNLDGHGWHLDRDHFDQWLQLVAQERGAALLTQARLVSATRQADATASWHLQLERMGRPLAVRTRFVLDASGRNSSFARHLGGKRSASDKLVCGWLFGHDAADAGGASELHAEEMGWWYTAPLPGRRRLVAFYTDADLPSAPVAHTARGLLARMELIPAVLRPLREHGFRASGEHGFCAANGALLDQPCGPGWLAVGDAALTFDPLSSQGLFNALYTGLAGAEAAQRHLQGDPRALPGYREELARIHAAYVAHLDAWYGQEQRWSASPFWRRRQQRLAAVA